VLSSIQEGRRQKTDGPAHICHSHGKGGEKFYYATLQVTLRELHVRLEARENVDERFRMDTQVRPFGSLLAKRRSLLRPNTFRPAVSRRSQQSPAPSTRVASRLRKPSAGGWLPGFGPGDISRGMARNAEDTILIDQS
jgi:hypothetical protein